MKVEREDLEVLHTSTIKAGSRRYYIDIKATPKAEKYIVITESKKVKHDDGNSYEKNRIRLYPEDFSKFLKGLQETIKTIEDEKTDL